MPYNAGNRGFIIFIHVLTIFIHFSSDFHPFSSTFVHIVLYISISTENIEDLHRRLVGWMTEGSGCPACPILIFQRCRVSEIAIGEPTTNWAIALLTNICTRIQLIYLYTHKYTCIYIYPSCVCVSRWRRYCRGRWLTDGSIVTHSPHLKGEWVCVCEWVSEWEWALVWVRERVWR